MRPSPEGSPSAPEASSLGEVLIALLADTTSVPASELEAIVDIVGKAIGASSARVLLADYGLVSLVELGADGPTGPRQQIDGTLAGRAFARGEVVVSGEDPVTVHVPLAEGSERLGVLELTHEAWSDEVRRSLDPIVRVLVLVLISKRRYTDVVLRGRRAERLSLAAEMQWTLLPPLTCSTDQVSVSGILEPAYTIGGDSFDYALNPDRLEFAIVDAMGHGMSAVATSVLAINGIRNARREELGLDAAYLATGDAIEAQVGPDVFATGQIGSLAVDTGELTWLNAGHPPPLLVRHGGFVGELACRPSMPMGLRGQVTAIETIALQPGDRVLFYTDGVTESTSAAGEPFGLDRLVDHLVRATLDGTAPAETVRRLSASILGYNAMVLSDDATLLLLEYHGPTPA